MAAMTPAPTKQCVMCGRLFWDGPRFCSRCGTAVRPLRAGRTRTSDQRPLLAGLLAIVVLVAAGVAWTVYVAGSASYGGGGGAGPVAAESAYLASAPVTQVGTAPDPGTSSATGSGVGASPSPPIAIPSGLTRHSFPAYGLEFALPAAWRPATPAEAQTFSKAVGDELRSQGVALLSVYVDEASGMVLTVLTDTEETDAYDTGDYQVTGRMFVESFSDAGSGKIGMSVETIGGRTALVSDLVREQNAYGRVVVLFGRRRALCFACFGGSAGDANAAYSQLRSVLGYVRMR